MNADYTHISILLDRSGSMRSILTPMIDGFNEFIGKQKAAGGKATVSVSQFDDVYEILQDTVDINDIPELTKEVYVPRGMTALNDSTVKLINETGKKLADMSEDERPAKVLFVVISDGAENASTDYRDDLKLAEVVNHQKDKYSWEFVYIGANQDSRGQSGGKGMNNYVNYSASLDGVKNMFDKLNVSTALYRSASVGSKFEIDGEEDLNEQQAKSTNGQIDVRGLFQSKPILGGNLDIDTLLKQSQYNKTTDENN